MAGALVSWEQFSRSAPDMAAAGRRLLRGDGTAVAYLATVRKDGGPRVHPVMPVLTQHHLYLFIVNLGWKYRDLVRDGRFALHASPPPEGGEEFYVTGEATESIDPAERARARAGCDQRLGGHDFEALFRCRIERALHTEWQDWGGPSTWPKFTKWSAAG